MQRVSTANRTMKVGAIAAATAAVAFSLSACSPTDGEAAGGETVITCASCQEGEDLFLQYNYDAAQRFNEKYEGQYRIETLNNQNAGSGAERLSYYQRLALADDLPDVFLLDKQETITLSESAELLDFNAALDADPEWKDSFYPDALATLNVDGVQLGLPEVRDVVGIYANTTILEDAGVGEFPQTWDELEAACDAVSASGKTCLAMDGNWVTLLMWANLIGTQDGGTEFLESAISGDDWATEDIVVDATETLRSWHEKGYVNVDSLSGDYANAATVFQTGEAAMIANGPWMLGDIKSDASAPGLADATTYNVAPGWAEGEGGVVSITGGSWVSGSQDEAKQEAAIAFFKFLSSGDEPYEQTVATGSYPAVQTELTAEQADSLDPLIAGAVEAASVVPFHYPNATANAASTFGPNWLNLWPAYVQGELDTTTFLERLATDG